MKSHEELFWEAPVDSLLDADTTAAGLKHQRRWLNKLIAGGGGPTPVRLSRKLLFRKRDVLRWLDERISLRAGRSDQ